MIRRTPCEYYLKYLLVHPDKYSEEDIESTFRELHLDFPSVKAVKSLRKTLRPPAVFRPYDERHVPSFEFLVHHGIYRMFHPDSHTRAALYLLRQPWAKEAIESMTMVGDSYEVICRRLHDVKIKATPVDVDRYCYFFWNIKLVDRTELTALLKVRVESMISDGEDESSRIRYKAMKNASYEDPRTAILRSPVTPFAGIMNQLRMGRMPPRIDMGKLLNAGVQIAALRAMEESIMRDPAAPQRARDLSLVARNLKEMVDMMGSPDEDLRRDLMSLGISTDDNAVPHIQQLTQGDHTVDVQPTEEHVIK